MPVTINASPSNGLVQTADGSGIIKVQSNGVTTNALAWVNFNGTTSPGTIRSQYNVSSVTKNGTGDYTLNFTTALSDANYSAVGSGGGDNYNTNGAGVINFNYNKTSGTAVAPTTSAVRLVVGYSGVDQPYMYIAVFGN